MDARKLEGNVRGAQHLDAGERTQVDEYRNEFQPLKNILANSGFDIRTISFRQNDAGTWDVRDIIQRLECFLKGKPNLGPQLYKGKSKALKMYIDQKTPEEFLALSDVMVNVIFLV